MSQAPEECALPERMKEGRSGVRCRRPPGRVRKPGWGVRLMLQRSERRWGQRESSGVSDWAGCVCVGGWAPPCVPDWKLQALLLAEQRGRREAPDGLQAPPAGCGGSRSQSGARAQTSGRQRTPASGPQGPRGGRGARAAGRRRGRSGGGTRSPALPASGPRGPRLSPALAPRSRFLPGGGLVGRAVVLREFEPEKF